MAPTYLDRKSHPLRSLLAALLVSSSMVLSGGAAVAQQQADQPTLLADQIVIDDEGRLVATGHVQVFHQGTALTASEVIYDRDSDALTLSGPILIQRPDGTVISAEAGQLDQELRGGLLQGARMVLDQQLQLAANEVRQSPNGVTRLTRVAATSCQVCGTSTPLWQIRAARVTHDTESQQIWFENAVLMVRDVPIAWLPALRVPAPGVARARGFLAPGLVTSTSLGAGVRLPYFLPIGDSRDVTLTPYLAANGKALQADYRQAFSFGRLRVNTLVGRDEILPDDLRYYIDAAGDFRISPGTTMHLQLQQISDTAVMNNYGYSYADRLQTGAEVLRINNNILSTFGFWGYRSLRGSETNRSLPPYLAFGRWEQDVTLPYVGGRLTYGAEYAGLWRTDDTPGPLGRDVSRLSTFAEWSRNWTLPMGLRLRTEAASYVLAYGINDDPAYYDQAVRVQPSIATTLSWPLMRRESGGRTQYLEPIISIGWADGYGRNVPNEDSPIVELDTANMFALQRYPGQDAVESGARMGIGLRWGFVDPSGWAGGLTVGRILRQDFADSSPISSGTAERANDLLLEAELVSPAGFSLDARTLINDKLDGFGKSELRLNWYHSNYNLTAAFINLPEEPWEDRPRKITELTLGGAYRFNDTWRVSSDLRYDFAASQIMRNGFSMQWQNECVVVDLSVSRRYTSALYVEPATEFGLSVNLTGFSVGGVRRASSACGT
ncbi:organic solvent tolerance protein [Ketogulonicigenium robustum]|uniref:LPS-assembly protein LptD n=1 Tax=Ketogulonicigenium robustum TaxID=92947 RepID=A0A1W6P086_9RHOB|nr:LPS assembly protein LptD [Ketogulonicigenium robustum]ARO14740.1 organic solvent tolerance protein [Ketogulonicigenium robustum]